MTKKSSSRGLVAGAILGAVAIALAGYSASQASPGAPTDAAFSNQLSVLARPAAPGDTLPPELSKLPLAEKLSESAARESRKLGDLGGRTFWVVPGLNGELCFIASSGSGDKFESAGTCADPSQLTKGGIWFSETWTEDTQSVSILLPDGVRSVSGSTDNVVAVQDNIAVVQVKASDDSVMAVTDAFGRSYTIELGDITPPA